MDRASFALIINQKMAKEKQSGLSQSKLTKPLRTVNFLPTWVTELTASTLRVDVVAGVALAGLLVPEGMAYAGPKQSHFRVY